MKKLITLSAMALLAVAGLCMAQDTTKVDKYAFPPLPQELKHADSLLAAGDSANGLAELRAIVNSKAEDEVRARAQYNIAKYYDDQLNRTGTDIKKIRYYRQRSYDEYSTMLAMAPESTLRPWALLYMTFVLPKGMSKDVIYRQIINDYPNSEVRKQALSSMAQTLFLEGKNNESIAAYRQYIKDYPENRYECASALYHIGQITNDIDVYREVINDYPDQDHFVLRSFSGISGKYYKNGDYQRATEVTYESFRKFKHKPVAVSILISIYHTYQDIKDYDKAEKVKQQIITEYPESAAAKSFMKR
jgi:tetratricopeptide (TPR) repeat protein